MDGQLRIDADLDQLGDVRQFIRRRVASGNPPADCVDDLVQAVDEAVTNVIIHGYQGQPGWLQVSVATEDDRFVVTIQDQCRPFDPTTVPEPDLAVPPMDRTPGGMGIHLIRESTDSMTYTPRPGGGNILTMIRARRAGGRQEG